MTSPMPEEDPKYLRSCAWTRRNGEEAEGTVIDREGAYLIINAPDVRAVPFKVPERKVHVISRKDA